MTFEQALKTKQNLTAEQVRNDLERYLLRNEPPIHKGVAIAMQTLEKQIPKKVTAKKRDEDEYPDSCPNCSWRTVIHFPHCQHCGQALDWSDVKWP